MRLIVDPPLRGSLNMAIDKALLQSAAESGVATMRIYQWAPATISLGYFQASASREGHGASSDCPIVRRASGGGAIVHDREMTYSLALPSKDRWASENRDLFDRVHRTLIDSLDNFGVSGCDVFREPKPESRSEPFLCFERRAKGDVILGGYKIIGSAQRRLQSALLQHGSVLVGQSACAPELPGAIELSESAACTLTLPALIEEWPGRLAHAMGWNVSAAELTQAERDEAESIEAKWFGNDEWTYKR